MMTDSVQIRTMTVSDYDAVYDMWINTSGMGLNDLDDSREGIEKFLKRNPETCFAAVENGRVIGAIMCGHDGRRGYIYHTSVREEYRGRGIGTALADSALAALESEGINKAALVVFARNEKGNAFWEKLGFTQRSDIIYRNRELKELVRFDT